MKKTKFLQVSVALTNSQRDWLYAQKMRGFNMSSVVRQALEAFIASWGEEEEDEEEFDAVCGGGQGYCHLVELPMVDEEGDHE